jgi:hypothetical protein
MGWVVIFLFAGAILARPKWSTLAAFVVVFAVVYAAALVNLLPMPENFAPVLLIIFAVILVFATIVIGIRKLQGDGESELRDLMRYQEREMARRKRESDSTGAKPD